MLVEVLPYNRKWPADFTTIKSHLSSILNQTPHSSIEHVGSTSVPGLWAKPVIDVDIIVPSSADVMPAIEQLVAAGYAYYGEMGIPDRHAVKAPEVDKVGIRRNVYVCIDGCIALRNHLGVRDILRSNEQLREEYSLVKRALSEREVADIDEYIEGKSEVLQKILSRIDLTEEERKGILKVNMMPSSGSKA
jgi:GrpB-like predicted nucleotidyltransferase (UPF0157 family)